MSPHYFVVAMITLTALLSSLTSADTETDQLFASIQDDIPPRAEGQGQYDQLIIRGAYLIDGTGAPATGPVDVVVELDISVTKNSSVPTLITAF